MFSQFESLVNQAGQMYSSMVMKERTLESATASDMLNQIKEKWTQRGQTSAQGQKPAGCG